MSNFCLLSHTSPGPFSPEYFALTCAITVVARRTTLRRDSDAPADIYIHTQHTSPSDMSATRRATGHTTGTRHAQTRRETSAVGAPGSGASARVHRRRLARRSAENGALRRARAAAAAAARQPSAALSARLHRPCTPPLPAAAAARVAPPPAAIARSKRMVMWAPARDAKIASRTGCSSNRCRSGIIVSVWNHNVIGKQEAVY